MSSVHSEEPVTGLGRSATERILTELGPAAGSRVVRSLATAEALLHGTAALTDDLRFPESAAYNIREALDSVVQDQPPGESGFAAANKAWTEYKTTIELPGADERAALNALTVILDDLTASKERQGFMTTRLLERYQKRTGVQPISGESDPLAQYQQLRESAAQILHSASSRPEVAALFGESVAWFARFFTPPSTVAGKIEQLAGRDYSQARLDELRTVAVNGHQVGQFLARVGDPAWLGPIRDAGLIGLPKVGEVWVGASLASESAQLPDQAVARFLKELLGERKVLPKGERLACVHGIMHTAWQLGPAGIDVILAGLRLFPADHFAQTIAITAAKAIDDDDPVHVAIADAVICNVPDRRHRHRTEQVLAPLIAGLNSENVDERIGLMATKVRKLAVSDLARFLDLDLSRLSSLFQDDDLREPLIETTQSLAAAIPTARRLGVRGPTLLAKVAPIPGERGERLTCQALAGADDIDREIKLLHLERRFGSQTATGDDQELVDDLMPLGEADVERLRAAFGSPTPKPDDGDKAAFPDDWARAWRWTMVLPDPILTGWEQAIAVVSEVHGPPDPSTLSRSSPQPEATWGSSPILAEDLSQMGVLEAASMVSRWRPGTTGPFEGTARELARALEAVVAKHPEVWANDPSTVVKELREPIYVEHYFRALAGVATSVATQATALISAIELVRRERWEPSVIGSDDFEYERNWSSADLASIQLIRMLADADADLTDSISRCWDISTSQTMALPDDHGAADKYERRSEQESPINRAINAPYGNGLQAVIALGGWEFRRSEAQSMRLGAVLTDVLAIEGAVGVELRAIIARSRPYLETIASDWMERHHQQLFEGVLGSITFDQTIKYSHPTKRLFQQSFQRFIDAALRSSDHAAKYLIVANLWEHPGYTFDTIIDGLAGETGPLADLSRELPLLVRGLSDDQAEIFERGIALWEELLGETRQRIPASALRGLGGWSMAMEIADERWLALTEQTVKLTGGEISYMIEVAERCRDAQPAPEGLRIIAELLGHGERDEQNYVGEVGVEALRAAVAAGLDDEAVTDLRERLVQRGRHEAASVVPA